MVKVLNCSSLRPVPGWNIGTNWEPMFSAMSTPPVCSSAIMVAPSGMMRMVRFAVFAFSPKYSSLRVSLISWFFFQDTNLYGPVPTGLLA